MRGFIVFLSFLYLIFEVFFNINFVNIISKDNLVYYSNIDFWGRHVASIGATILFLKFINLFFSIDKFLKMAFTFIFAGVFYFSFFNAQEKLIDLASDSTPFYIKQNVANSYIYQKGFINNGSNFINIPESVSFKGNEKAVFNSSLGFLAFSVNGFMDTDPKTIQQRYAQIMLNDLSIKSDYYYKAYLDMSNKTFELEDRYQRESYELKESVKNASTEGWRLVENKKDQIKENYNSLKRTFDKKVEKEQKKYFSAVSNAVGMLFICRSEECFNKFKKELVYISQDAKYKFPYSITFENNCTISKKTTTEYNRYQTTVYGYKEYKTPSHLDKYSSFKSLNCNVDLRGWEKQIEYVVQKDFQNKYGVDELTHQNSQDYFASGAFERQVHKEAKRNGFKLPKNWHRNDKETFIKSVNRSNDQVANKAFDNAMIDQFGFSVPLGLSREDFLTNKQVDQKFKEEFGLGYFFFDLNTQNEKDYYLNTYAKKIKEDNGVYYYSKMTNDFEFVNDIFKMNIIPLFSISMSLIFGLLNFCMILNYLLMRVFNITGIASYVSFIIVTGVSFYLPTLAPVSYHEQPFLMEVISGFEYRSPALALYYEWFLNFETIVYNFFKDSVLLFDFIDEAIRD